MLYSLTVVRISNLTGKFENTEQHSILLYGDVERQLLRHAKNLEDLDTFCKMQKGDSKTIQLENEDHIWFYYISCFN